MTTKTPPCKVCGYKPNKNYPDREDQFWECSHVECPNRHKITAAPSDRLPTQKENQ